MANPKAPRSFIGKHRIFILSRTHTKLSTSVDRSQMACAPNEFFDF